MFVIFGAVGLIDKSILEAVFSKPIPDDYVVDVFKMGLMALGIYIVGRYIVSLGKKIKN